MSALRLQRKRYHYKQILLYCNANLVSLDNLRDVYTRNPFYRCKMHCSLSVDSREYGTTSELG